MGDPKRTTPRLEGLERLKSDSGMPNALKGNAVK